METIPAKPQTDAREPITRSVESVNAIAAARLAGVGAPRWLGAYSAHA